MVQASQAFWLRYGSFRTLQADHEAYLVHGGLVLSAEVAPNERIQVRLCAPDGTEFPLEGRTGQSVPGQGVLVSFEPSSAEVQSRLDRFVRSRGFAAAQKAEPPERQGPPQVEAADVITQPGTAPVFDDDTQPRGVPPRGTEPASTNPADELGHLDRHLARAEQRVQPTPAEQTPTELRQPEPGEPYPVYVVIFGTVTEFAREVAPFRERQRLHVPVRDPDVERGHPVRVRLQLPGRNQFEMWGVVERVDLQNEQVEVRVSEEEQAYRRALLHLESRNATSRMEREARPDHVPEQTRTLRIEEKMPTEDESKMPIRRRLQRMGMDDKINLALAGGREERMALAMDSNKAIHHHLLKNAKISLDEIAFMARLPSLNPDVLDKISENPQYTQNPQITKALVFNPRTPVRTAIRLLDRMSRNDLVALSKRNNMNTRLVMAAKKKVTGSKL